MAPSRTFKFTPSSTSRFELRVERAVELSGFKDHYTSRKRYRPADDARLVAVVYKFANRGTQPAEAASGVNKLATLADARGSHYRVADSVQVCTAASSSAAVVVHASSPEKDAGRDMSYRTVALYAVPKSATGLRWTVGAVQVRVQPRPSRGGTR